MNALSLKFINRSLLTLVALLSTAPLFAQVAEFGGHSVSIRATPVLMRKPLPHDASPAGLSANRSLAFDGGLTYMYTLKSGTGIGVGAEMGYTNWNYGFNNPGQTTIISDIRLPEYIYKAVSVYASQTFRFNGFNLRIYGGPAFRFYTSAHDEISVFATAGKASVFRGEVSAPAVPASGDYLSLFVDHPAGTQHMSFSGTVAFEKTITKKGVLFIGLRKNWDLAEIAEGDLTLRVAGQTFRSTYSPLANYGGLDIGYRYNFPQKEKQYKAPKSKNSYTNSRKSVYGEFLGNGGVASVNYDQRFSGERTSGFGFRVGVGTGADGTELTLPVAINHVVGNARHGLETGLGVTPIISQNRLNNFYGNGAFIGFLNVGYRFQPLREGFLFRLTYAPYINKHGYHPVGAGASVGYTFR